MGVTIQPSDIYYYSDMDIFEFTAANRPLFERLGAKSWEECQAMAEQIQPTLPNKPRPYTRQNPIEVQKATPEPPQRATTQWIEVKGDSLEKLYALKEKTGKSLSVLANDILTKYFSS